MTEKVTTEYRICAINDSDIIDGYVEVFMDPVDKTVFDPAPEQGPGCPNVIMKSGGEMPVEIQQMMQHIPKQMKQVAKQMNKHNDPRNILLIESRVDFDTCGWKYGDTLKVTFEKKEEK